MKAQRNEGSIAYTRIKLIRIQILSRGNLDFCFQKKIVNFIVIHKTSTSPILRARAKNFCSKICLIHNNFPILICQLIYIKMILRRYINVYSFNSLKFVSNLKKQNWFLFKVCFSSTFTLNVWSCVFVLLTCELI